MHPAVELLISRMKTNPEDFKGNNKWMQAFNDYKKHFSKDDLIAAEHAYKEMRMVQFQGRLFDLMAQEEPRLIDLTMTPIAQSGQPVSYSVGTSSLVNDMEEEIRKQFELFKEEEKIKLEMQREIHNPRL